VADDGTVRYHRAEYLPGSNYPWALWFTAAATDGQRFRFTAAEGEAMGLTPPEPAPLVGTCNGHSVELPEWELDDFIAEWGEDGIEDYSAGSSRLATRFAYWLRDARQDPQPASTVEIGGQVMTQAQFDAARFPLLNPAPQIASDPQPAPADSDTLDFDAMPIGTVLWDASDSDFLLRFPGGWSYNPPADEDDYYDIDADIDKFTLVYQPAPVSPSEGLRAVLAGRDDADELIEYAATSYRSDRVLGPGRHLLSAVGDAARSGGAK
jgi:hypothetical protein